MDNETNLHDKLFNQSGYKTRIRPGNPVNVSAIYNLRYLNAVVSKAIFVFDFKIASKLFLEWLDTAWTNNIPCSPQWRATIKKDLIEKKVQCLANQ